MTTQQNLPVHHSQPHTTRAWIAIVLTPLAWALGLLGGLAGGEGAGKGFLPALVGVIGMLVMLAAPTAAVMLASKAVIAQEPASRVVLVVAVLALIATIVALPLLLTSGLGWLVATAVVVAALAVFARTTRRHT